jgi:hypothetical protein
MAFQDVISTGLFQPTEAVASVPAAIHDLVLGAFSGRRGVVAETPASFARSYLKGGAKGLRQAPEIWRHGATREQLERLELPTELNTGSRVVDFIPNAISRVRASIDNVPFEQALGRESRSRARAIALTEAKQGKIARSDVSARTEELLNSMSNADAAETLFDVGLAEATAKDARVATFNNENVISEFIQGSRERAGQWGGFFVDLLVPFSRAVPNIIKRGAEYTPAGSAMYGYRVLKHIVKREFSLEDQRQLSKLFGRTATGSGLTALGYYLAKSGYIIGTDKRTPSERNLDEAAGRKPLAIYDPFFGMYRSIDWLGPAAYPLGLGANIAESSTPEEFKDASWNLFIRTHPLTRGAQEMLAPMTESGASYEKRAGRMLSTFVPAGSFVRDVAMLTDTKEREAEGLTGPFMRNMPGLRQQLPVKRDALGQDAQYSRWWGVDPGRSTVARDRVDPVLAHLVKHRVGISEPKKKAGELAESYRRRSVATAALQRARLESAVNHPGFKSPPSGFGSDLYQRAVLEGALRVAEQDADEGRAPKEGEAKGILFNARVELERDRVAEQMKRTPAYEGLSEKERERFIDAINQEFGQVKVSFSAKSGPVAEQMGEKLERLAALKSGRAELKLRAVMRAKGIAAGSY